MFGRQEEINRFLKGFVKGYGWVEGIHGIGKTTLARHVIQNIDTERNQIFYLDLRTLYHGYNDLVACLLHRVFSTKPTSDAKQNFLIFRELACSTKAASIRLILDELDIYSPNLVDPVRHLAESKEMMMSIVFISAKSKWYFEHYDPSSKIIGLQFQRLEAFRMEECMTILKDRGVTDEAAKMLTDLSGGNPTLIDILMVASKKGMRTVKLDMSQEFSHSLNSYFEAIWAGLEEHHRNCLLVAAILFATVVLDKPEKDELLHDADLSRLGVKLNGLHAFGQNFSPYCDLNSAAQKNMHCKTLPFLPPISPLFHAWLLTYHGRNIKPEKLLGRNTNKDGKEKQMFGVTVSRWAAIGQVVSVLDSVAGLAGRFVGAMAKA